MSSKYVERPPISDKHIGHIGRAHIYLFQRRAYIFYVPYLVAISSAIFLQHILRHYLRHIYVSLLRAKHIPRRAQNIFYLLFHKHYSLYDPIAIAYYRLLPAISISNIFHYLFRHYSMPYLSPLSIRSRARDKRQESWARVREFIKKSWEESEQS
jgi:hypothetical protein